MSQQRLAFFAQEEYKLVKKVLNTGGDFGIKGCKERIRNKIMLDICLKNVKVQS